jgi:hypothetical protein
MADVPSFAGLIAMIHESAHSRGRARVTTGSSARGDPGRAAAGFRVRRVAIQAETLRFRERVVGPDGGKAVLFPVTPRASALPCRSIPLAVRRRVAEPARGFSRGDAPVALRESGERGPPVGCNRPAAPTMAFPDALCRPRGSGVWSVSRVGMAIGAVKRLVDPIRGIVDLEDPARPLARHPQLEAVAKEAPLLVRSPRGPRRDGQRSRERPEQDGDSSAAAIQRRTSHRR